MKLVGPELLEVERPRPWEGGCKHDGVGKSTRSCEERSDCGKGDGSGWQKSWIWTLWAGRRRMKVVNCGDEADE